MKNLKLMMVTTLFTILFSVGAFAQNSPKIIAVINKADWCSVCKANEERAMNAFKENNKDGVYQFVINDISNAETAKKSAIEINKLGLAKVMEPYKATGIVCLFDAKTKKPINQLLMSLSSEDIAKAMAYFKMDK
ncbi:hypothetical protein ACG2LH_17455 [Zhouia sp. PK063]|uniref:hypothetical protein n=1 Tax=Zhouia sp. PK063 TaxID=3373602 RepID=UPI0037AA640E